MSLKQPQTKEIDMEIIETDNIEIGDKVEQVYHGYVGRKATVVDIFVDEKGLTHVKTDDGFWVPKVFLKKIP